MAILTVTIMGLLPLARIGDTGEPRSRSMPASGPPSAAPPGMAVRMDGGTEAQATVLAGLLRSRDDFARDVLFLLASGLRDRCDPSHAHELARMAVLARLPVLEGMTDALSGQPELRPVLYAMIRRLVATAPCGRRLDIDAGGYALRLDPEPYALHFPDSYFDPGLDVAPPDIAGRDLRERLGDPCTPVAYGVLPLGDQRAWVCTNLRANLRKRALATCEASLRGKPGLMAPPSPEVSATLAEAIHRDLSRMPAMCQ
ncbi:hypothetical protein [Dyella sedimenti]|uniref:hypothetical protein n=1 Tax=Dyella sedimenti TaxID=2919947 RepID=UPI001FAA48C9|nr:hypothetical protein [Dyella sedimenti]